MNVNDRIAWTNLVKKFSGNADLSDRLFTELTKKYSGRNRFYHNWSHILDLLQMSDEYSSMLKEKDIVHFSIYYHDFVYNVLRKDNEMRSAVIADKRLRELQVPEEKVNEIKVFIEATQTHKIPAGYSLAADLSYFLDFDMAILAAEPARYKLYTEQVKKEYRIYPLPMYRAGRKKFLEACLQGESIFHTAEFRGKYEPRARQNIQQELATY
jgi:predicted metal-dependent HD superfamily phosphohydrolase